MYEAEKESNQFLIGYKYFHRYLVLIMNKKLVDLFDLPSTGTEDEFPTPMTKEEIEQVTEETYGNLDKIENALPQVRGLEASDLELDELARMAVEGYKDLSDLGMQVDSRFASEIFSAAGTMLGHAITAKTAKINKKLKMIDLQLKKAALDQKSMDKVKEIESTPEGEGSLLDRNELLKAILANKNNKQDK